MKQSRGKVDGGVSRKGRVMTCINCGETKHNARGCDKPPNKEKRQGMLDEDEEVGQHPQEEINLTAPQCNQASQGLEFVFMPTPSVYRETSSCVAAFEHPELEDEPAIRRMVMSEEKTRLQQRQQPSQPSGSRVIAFKGNYNGLSIPSNLPYSPESLTWKGKAAITGRQLEMQSSQRIEKLVPRKRNK
uniref:Uncharacterized protein LOC104247055 n=1 Tax=Nicotiana sylvestris TaxID=4096 RepID=A0A1U7YH73_NICSY|nr:PREDICTED: uncharacterized protein LOC104247055 [Nicotiana sylvestris]